RLREASLQPAVGGWRIAVDGRVTLIPERIGLTYLAELVSCPGRDIDVLLLASDGALSGPPADEVVDQRALESYRLRARELRTMIGRGDLTSSVADDYGQELATLTAVLDSSTGLGGRVRAFPDNNQRARTAVRKALVRAVAAVESVEPDLGHHLRTSVATGVTCRYSPAPGWKVTAQR
ncbi:MAG TPA: hypothetical protein VIJ09_07135, partial [Acidimicrobiales bacterium]